VFHGYLTNIALQQSIHKRLRDKTRAYRMNRLPH
jgi:hypothetical protein